MTAMPIYKIEARAMLFWLVTWLDQGRKLTEDDCIEQVEKSYEVIWNTARRSKRRSRRFWRSDAENLPLIHHRQLPPIRRNRVGGFYF